MSHVYSSEICDYTPAGSRASASVLVPFPQSALPIGSRRDVRARASEQLTSGVADIAAIDEANAESDASVIPADKFLPQDHSAPPQLANWADVLSLYRYKSVFYEAAAAKELLAAKVFAARLRDDLPLDNGELINWQMRRATITCILISLKTILANKEVDRKTRSLRRCAA